MDAIIANYWAQIAFILAALGYLCKILLDHSFKRREIGYSIYAKERLSAITSFINTYEKGQKELRAYAFTAKLEIIKGRKPEYSDDALAGLFNQLSNEMRHCRLFLNSTEFDLFHRITSDIEMMHSELFLMEVTLSLQELSRKEAFNKWHDEFDSTLNKNERLLEGFIDALRLKFSRIP